MTTPHPDPKRIAAAIATFRRDEELVRLFTSLASSTVPFDGGVFVADNAASEETAAVCAAAPLPVTWLPRSANNGPGAAWNTAVSAALADNAVTHVLVLDDDVVPPSDTVDLLLQAMGESSAAAAPLLFDEKERLWAFPEPRPPALRRAIRRVHAVSECRAALGPEAHPFCWATGACMLYARRAFETGGFCEDFWMLGEDLEFSMRVASTLGGVFTASVAVAHLPPPGMPGTAAMGNRLKFLALLQNLSYLAFHSPHSSHMRGYLPGNFKRYLLTEDPSPAGLRDAWRTFWHGALRGRPAGHASGVHLREKVRHRMQRDRPE